MIASRQQRIRRVTPHLAEAGEATIPELAPLPADTEDTAASAPPPRGSQARGLVLHKMLEEVLTGEITEDQAALASRAAELAAQLAGTPGGASFDPAEAARSVRRGLDRPEIAAVRNRLQAEYSVACSAMEEGCEVVTSGVADAVVWDGDRIELVVDWKSDVNPAATTVGKYRGQVEAYLSATGASAGLIVFLTSGHVEPVLTKGKT